MLVWFVFLFGKNSYNGTLHAKYTHHNLQIFVHYKK